MILVGMYVVPWEPKMSFNSTKNYLNKIQIHLKTWLGHI